MGARPLARVIQENIKKPLANEILFGKLKKGGVVKVTVGPKEDGKPGILLESVSETAPIKPKPEAEVIDPSIDDGDDGDVALRARPKKSGKKTAAGDTVVAKAPRKGTTVPKVPRQK
jgi:ATP-dependent Clp protease ATP-binding subunit ClpA